MAENFNRERLQPSLLDRLTDHAPENKRESADQQSLSYQQLRKGVLRDLAWLLNTTDLATTEDLTGLPLTGRSTLNFGIAGFTGLTSGASKMAKLEGLITDAIRNFEPRIKPDSLRVTARETVDSSSPVPTLVFEIAGELWAQPVPQQLFLETSIELETRMAVVTDAKARG